MREQAAIQNALRARLDTLRIRYPRYSVRAFAKKAGVSPGTLSLILQGKRRVSQKLAAQLCERLAFDPVERADIFRHFIEQKLTGQKAPISPERVQLTIDQYQLISDWRAFALLNLIKTKNFQNKPTWIANRLGVTADEVRETIARLKRLEMIDDSHGSLKRMTANYDTTNDIPNLSLRQSHRQTLELAHEALDRQPVELRDFTWLTFALDLKTLPVLKELISKFHDDVQALVDQSREPTEVYRLAVQLFALTKIQEPEGVKG